MKQTTKVDRAVILAAGMGTRLGLGPDTKESRPKPLVELGDRPMVLWVLEALQRCGISLVTLVVGWQGEVLESFAASQPVDGLKIDCVQNDEWRKSNGVSLLKARSHVDEPFVLLMSDHIFEDGLLTGLLDRGPLDKGVVLAVDRGIKEIFDIDDATKVRTQGERIVAIDKALDDYDAVDCGVFLCTPAVFEALEGALVDGDCSLSDGMRALGVQDRFAAHDIGGTFWQDVDTPEMYAFAEKNLHRLG